MKTHSFSPKGYGKKNQGPTAGNGGDIFLLVLPSEMLGSPPSLTYKGYKDPHSAPKNKMYILRLISAIGLNT
jgi:hypothetical protein